MTKGWALVAVLPLLACTPDPRPPGCGEEATCPPNRSCQEGVCVEVDADSGVDAGAPDAGDDGGSTDAGTDAGAPDGGEDAGADAGVDAGPVDAGCGPPDAGNPPNRLLNPGFECGDPPIDWMPSPSGSLLAETADPHSGASAARLVADDGGVVVSLFPEVALPNSGLKLWCASAWIRGVPAGGTARISLRTLTQAGGLLDHNFSAPMTTAFSKVSVSAATQALDDRVLLRLWMVSPAKGDVLVVDDAEVWVSADGGCGSR
ncbi:MAG: hypothetical protein ACYC8T_06365 [Myxococcaceae bacterium]